MLSQLEAELNDQKAQQEAPPWFSVEGYASIQGRHLLPGETVRGMFTRVAEGVEKHIGLTLPGLGQDIFTILWQGYLGLATPVAANFNAGRGFPVSCFSVHIPDSLIGIYEVGLTEAAYLSSKGGGVGVYYGDIRPTGTPFGAGGHSGGVIPWARQFDIMAEAVSQGGVRRGSVAHYLPIEHPDVRHLIEAKREHQGDPKRKLSQNIAVTITDAFMHRLIAGDTEAIALWNEVLKSRLSTGSPYILFIDTVNRARPEGYVNNNLLVSTSNLCCLLGGEQVLTKEGPVPIRELVGRTVQIYDGTQWVENSAFELKGETNEFVEVIYGNGDFLHVTPNHRFPLRDGVVKTANELVPGDIIETHKAYGRGYPTRHGEVAIVRPYIIDEPRRVYCTTVPSTGFFALSDGRMTGNSEITLYTDEDHTLVCVLSSLNLDKWDEWRNIRLPNTRLSVVELGVYLLEAVCSGFIDTIKGLPREEQNIMQRALRSVVSGRAIGLGVMGYGALCQRRGIPFGQSDELNQEIFTQIQTQADNASRELALRLGEPLWCRGTGYRHTHRTAIAPTMTNSAIANCPSQGIEPAVANVYTVKVSSGAFVRKNPHLQALLASKGLDTPETWRSIQRAHGSVQHLTGLTATEKEIYLTARELQQGDLIRLAAARQPYIGQAQSLNLFVEPDVSPQDFARWHLQAWQSGVQSLYYVRSKSLQGRTQTALGSQAELYGRATCPYCKEALELLQSKGYVIEYTEQESGAVPQIYIEGRHIGGYAELVSYFEPKGEEACSLEEGECSSCEG